MEAQLEIADFKERIKFVIHQMTNDDGIVFPFVSVLCTHPTTETGIVHCPIDNSFMESGKTKDLISDVIIPHILEECDMKGMKPLVVVFVTEMFMWEAKTTKEEVEGFRKGIINQEEIKARGTKIDCVMAVFSDENGDDNVVYKRHVKGKKLGIDNHIIDDCTLELFPFTGKMEYAGRFSKLFKRTPKMN